MMTFRIAAVVWLSTLSLAAGNLIPVRLVEGPTEYEGRLEVFYNNIWGTVCDDKMNDDNCVVVCKQLGYTGGVVVRNAVTHYGKGTGPIWLDDVNCSGSEPDLDACLHRFWGKNDCKHEEDTGCKCSPKENDQLTPQHGSCHTDRHRIRAFDSAYPGIGRAEIQADNGSWFVICDDFWDDIDAAVFCQCLGYTNRKNFRAYWRRDVMNMTPKLSILYDSVHCTVAEMDTVQDIWQCQVRPSTGICDPAVETAAVACEEMPPVIPLAPPTVMLHCNHDALTVCYTSSQYTLDPSYLHTDPNCVHASATNTDDGACVNIPMTKCETATKQSDASSKTYCYNVLYAEPSTLQPSLIMGKTWERSVCCLLAKNGTVLSSFEQGIDEEPIVSKNSELNFTIKCYLDASFAEAIEFPINISRGQDIYCKVTVITWDPELWLIVPKCQFMPKLSGYPSYTFINNKCPTSAELGVNYYHFDGHNWGFKFYTPQFKGYDDLYVSCNCYVCDPSLDKKPYCDRTCANESEAKSRIRRHLALGWIQKKELEEVFNGPFHIQASKSGPVLSGNGELLITEEHHNEKEKTKSKLNYESELASQMTSSVSATVPDISVLLVLVIPIFLVLQWNNKDCKSGHPKCVSGKY